jgi:MoaA/NifB/PqqE/SkfB family radical SAM enzyme
MSRELVICMEFRCNSNCSICMIKDLKNRLKPISFNGFKKIVDENAENGKYDSLVISGGEVTLNEKLPEFAEYAKKSGNFRNIQIQTNGIKLKSYDYCRKLAGSGVNEFFVSIYGPDAETHESITRTPGSFGETMKGLENLDKLNVSVITNTVVTRLNYRTLPDIVEKISRFGNIKRMEFWNYNTMDREDKKDLLESNRNLKPYLIETIETGKAKGIPVRLMYFPECILGEHREALDNTQPGLIIDDEFWKQYRKNEFGNCLFREACGSGQCFGLAAAYIKKFGWDREILNPL